VKSLTIAHELTVTTSKDGVDSVFWLTSTVTYPCLLSAFLLPAKRISRRYAESPEGTGIRSTGSLDILCFI